VPLNAVASWRRYRAEVLERQGVSAGLLNIFVQVGFVVLVGLAAKNAILIVEFARDRQQEGASRFDAAVDAARVRLRPILMTSFAFILGVLPLVIAHGAGAEMRRTLGTAVFAGMIVKRWAIKPGKGLAFVKTFDAEPHGNRRGFFQPPNDFFRRGTTNGFRPKVHRQPNHSR
jgi:hypothetical protein